jgi:O-antigen/teichoic acid export membrane protein
MSFYGRTFAPRGAVLQVVLLSAALLAIQVPVGNMIAAFGRMWVGFLTNAAWAACFLGAAYALIAHGWGAQALACAYLIAYLAHAVWTFWFAAVVLKRSERISTYTQTGGSALESTSL